eukprot:Opistho-2@25429
MRWNCWTWSWRARNWKTERSVALAPGQHQGQHQEPLELGRKVGDDGLGVGAQGAVGDQAELHLAGIGQDADAQADVTGLRHPEHHPLDLGAAEAQRLGWAGHIGHHRRGLLGEDVQHCVLHRLDQQARHRQQTEGHDGLEAALQVPHARAHGVEPLDRIGNADRQHQRHEPEAVAQLVGLLQRPQVHRHHGADLLARRVLALLQQIAADGAGHAAQQHIVDRGMKRLAHGLDGIELQAVVPGHALVRAGLALEPRRRVVGHQGKGGDVADRLVAHARHVQGAVHRVTGTGRVHPGVHRLGHAGTGHADSLDRHIAGRTQEGVGQPVLVVARLLLALPMYSALI